MLEIVEDLLDLRFLFHRSSARRRDGVLPRNSLSPLKPALGANQGDESASRQTGDHQLAGLLPHQLQFLGLRGTYRDGHAASLKQLFQQRWRDLWRSRGDDDGIVRCSRGKALAAVAEQ